MLTRMLMRWALALSTITLVALMSLVLIEELGACDTVACRAPVLPARA